MREIIAGILTAEEQGSRLTAAARARAPEIVQAAKKLAEGIAASAREEGRREAERASAAALEAASREKAALLAAALAETGKTLSLDDAGRRRAAGEVVRLVLGN